MNILLSGATGFLGSHIAETLVEHGFHVMAIKRKSSNLLRCQDFQGKITWVDVEYSTNIINEITEFKPEVLIHAAWSGVNSKNREDWKLQEKNLDYLSLLFKIAKISNISRIIALGSQAEYGRYEGVVKETHPCNPVSPYGAIKVCASVMLKVFAEQNNIEWYWLRLFSIYGPREDANWLIPSTIRNLLDKKSSKLTGGDQKYDYLFVKDFARGILSVIRSQNIRSGRYNLSSGICVSLREMLSILEMKLSPEKKTLLFGALPYRPNQVMHMQGNNDLFQKRFQFVPETNIIDGLVETINYYERPQ